MYFPSGSIIADSRAKAKGLMVITSGKVTSLRSGYWNLPLGEQSSSLGSLKHSRQPNVWRGWKERYEMYID